MGAGAGTREKKADAGPCAIHCTLPPIYALPAPTFRRLQLKTDRCGNNVGSAFFRLYNYLPKYLANRNQLQHCNAAGDAVQQTAT